MSFLSSITSGISSLNPLSIVSNAVESACDTILPKNLEFIGDLAGLALDYSTGNVAKCAEDIQDTLQDLPQQLSQLTSGLGQSSSAPGIGHLGGWLNFGVQPDPPAPFSVLSQSFLSAIMNIKPNPIATAVTNAPTTPSSNSVSGSTQPPSSAGTSAPAGAPSVDGTAHSPASAAPATTSQAANAAPSTDATASTSSDAALATDPSKATDAAATDAAKPTDSSATDAAKATKTASDTKSTQSTKSSDKTDATSADAFFKLSDKDFMSALQDGKLPDSISKDPAQMQRLQLRMNQITQMNQLITTMISALHEMNKQVIQNLHV